MKFAATTVILFSYLVCAAESGIKLSTLKPSKNSSLEVGRVNIDLISMKDNKTLAKISGRLGDCGECIRGAALSGDFGVRLEGDSQGALKMVRKQTSKVEITSCPQDLHLKDNKASCEFNLNSQPMKLSFLVTQ